MAKAKAKTPDNLFPLLLVFVVIVASLVVSVSFISNGQTTRNSVSASTQYAP